MDPSPLKRQALLAPSWLPLAQRASPSRNPHPAGLSGNKSWLAQDWLGLQLAWLVWKYVAPYPESKYTNQASRSPSQSWANLVTCWCVLTSVPYARDYSVHKDGWVSESCSPIYYWHSMLVIVSFLLYSCLHTIFNEILSDKQGYT